MKQSFNLMVLSNILTPIRSIVKSVFPHADMNNNAVINKEMNISIFDSIIMGMGRIIVNPAIVP